MSYSASLLVQSDYECRRYQYSLVELFQKRQTVGLINQINRLQNWIPICTAHKVKILWIHSRSRIYPIFKLLHR